MSDVRHERGSTPSSGSGPLWPLRPLRAPKASDVLAEEIVGRIIRGDLREGDALPAERLLVRQTGLGRSAVREALRMLEIRGFVEIRAGRGGGAVVRHPDGHQLAASAQLVVRGAKVPLSTLLQTRALVEPHCAALATQRGDSATRRALEAANRQLESAEDVPGFLRANIAWHVAVARGTGNEVLVGLVETLAEIIYDSTGRTGPVDAEVRAQTCRAHHAITEAVLAGDVSLARRRMARHVDAYIVGVGDEAEVSLQWGGIQERVG